MLGISTNSIRLFQEEDTDRVICNHLVQEGKALEEVGSVPLGEIISVSEALGGYNLDSRKVESINPAIKFVSTIKGKRNQVLVCSGCIRPLSS